MDACERNYSSLCNNNLLCYHAVEGANLLCDCIFSSLTRVQGARSVRSAVFMHELHVYPAVPELAIHLQTESK